jgi:hypothetical protein
MTILLQPDLSIVSSERKQLLLPSGGANHVGSEDLLQYTSLIYID